MHYLPETFSITGNNRKSEEYSGRIFQNINDSDHFKTVGLGVHPRYL